MRDAVQLSREVRVLKIVSRFLILSSLILGVATSAAAQDGFRVSSVTIGSGQNAISGGLIAIVDAKTERGGFVEVFAGQEQAWLMFGRDFTGDRTKCSLYGTTGHFQAAPWAGLYAGCKLTVATVRKQNITIEGVARPGLMLYREPLSFRDDGVENPEDMFTVGLYATQVSFGGLAFNYTYLNFLDRTPNHLPGISYAQRVTPEVVIAYSATWNPNALEEKTGQKGRLMYFIGASWSPKS
jgi:hypothetical protein